jgi:hypothetical protein
VTAYSVEKLAKLDFEFFRQIQALAKTQGRLPRMVPKRRNRAWNLYFVEPLAEILQKRCAGK